MDMLAELVAPNSTLDEKEFFSRVVAAELECGIRYEVSSRISETVTEIPDSELDHLVSAYHAFLGRTALIIDTIRYGDQLDLVFEGRFRYSGTARAWAEIQADWANRSKFQGSRWTYVEFYSGNFDEFTLAAIDHFVAILERHRGGLRSVG